MRLHPRQTIPALLATLVLLGCGSNTPLAPSPAFAATPGSSSSDAGTDAPIQWHCITSASSWRPADCPVRSTTALRGEAAVSAPGAPANLAGTVAAARVTLTWTAPAGGDPPLSYVIEAGSTTGRADLAALDTGSTSQTLTVDSVPAGTYYVRVRARNGAGSSAASNEITVAVGVPSPATSCAAWANLQRGAGVPPATPMVSGQRTALFNAGGGIKAVGSKYYAAYFPSGFAASSRRRVIVTLHGTGGSPEAEWNDWNGQVQARNWGYLGLKYLDDATGVFDDENTIYANLKAMLDDVRASCDLANASLFLVGFSRGSAESFPVGYLDLVDRRLLKAVGNNSGAWNLGGPPPPTLQAIQSRGDRTAMSALRYWMYCGELDFVQGFPMCDGMSQARDFVQTYGATVASLYRDPAGMHGGLVRNSDALAQMFAYFESLP
jgi:hypothetical protein